MSDENHTALLFIEDIQWADEESRQLLSALTEEDPATALRNIMFMFGYRDEEADRAKQILRNTKGCLGIHLQNLDIVAIEELLSYHMGFDFGQATSPKEDLHQLSMLIESKTKGNPFHVNCTSQGIKTTVVTRDSRTGFSQTSVRLFVCNVI
jgi:predicted ATPase